MYDPKNEEDDMMEMEEERLRMREHVMQNVKYSFSFSITLVECVCMYNKTLKMTKFSHKSLNAYLEI